jgi:hypothetical protein
MQNREPIIFEEAAINPAGLTAFGFYDTDADFQTDGPKVAVFVARRLGYPVVDVELTHRQIYACFEEAITTYGNQVNQFNAREHMLSVQGLSTSVNITQKNIVSTPLPQLVKMSSQYGTEALSGGNVDVKKGSILATPGTQSYDLKEFALQNEGGKPIEIRRIYHQMPPAIARYYDPFATTGLGLTNLMSEFGFDGYSPPVTFVMMPAYEDLLRIQAIEINDMIRKSQYSFSIANNVVRFTPMFTKDTTVWFDYMVVDDKQNNPGGVIDSSTSGSNSIVSDFSNIPYDNIPYTTINDIGRLWIYRYTLAVAKELLGNIRSKYQEIPIPEASIRLDGETLRREGQEEKRGLIEELRETLEQTGHAAQMKKHVENAQAMQQMFQYVPNPIWIG